MKEGFRIQYITFQSLELIQKINYVFPRNKPDILNWGRFKIEGDLYFKCRIVAYFSKSEECPFETLSCELQEMDSGNLIKKHLRLKFNVCCHYPCCTYSKTESKLTL